MSKDDVEMGRIKVVGELLAFSDLVVVDWWWT
jgi:hypothetical protein